MGKRYDVLEKAQSELKVLDAIKLVKKNATSKFDETIEFNVNLKLEKKHSVRDTVTYKHGFGASKRVLVFAQEDKVLEAKEAGADYVGGEDLIEKILGGWLEFDVAISTTAMMRHVAKVARILGSKGLMPNPKAKTVSDDLSGAVQAVKAGQREFRANENGVINFPVGKASMSEAAIEENIRSLFEVVLRKKPSDLKGEYVQSVYLSSTMGVGLKLDKKSIVAATAA